VSEHVNLGVAGRVGYVGPLLSAFYPDVEDVFPVPHYYDAQGRVGFDLRPSETLDVTALISSDRTERTAPNDDPAREASEERSLAFQRVSARYARDLGDGTTVSAVLFGGADQSDQIARYGATETSIRTRTTLFGARGAWRSKLASFVVVEAGVDSLVQASDVTREGAVAVPPREGDVRVFGQPPPDQIASDDHRVTTFGLAPYGEADFGLFGDRLHVVTGLRFDPSARSVSHANPKSPIAPSTGLFLQNARFEPRVAVSLAPTDTTFVMAAWGMYSQQPQAADLSAAFGNPELPTAIGAHTVFGAGIRPIETLSIDATGFYTTSERLAMRNPSDQPARAEALAPSGYGRTYGAQVQVRLMPTKGVYGWVSYTLAWSERRDTEHAKWRPSDYDQRHTLTALAGYELPLGFEIGARVRVATGFPRTEVTGSWLDVRRDLYQPVFGDHNALRLPVFFQGDVRVAKHFDLGKTDLDVSLEVQNVTNRANVEEYVYDADYSTRGAITGLPILPVLGVRWSF